MENEEVYFTSLIHHKNDLNLHYICLTPEIMDLLKKFNKRVWVEINNTLKWQGGIVALGEGEGYITLSTARMKKLGVHFGEKVNVTIQPDNSEYGMEMATEFEAVLQNDSEAEERFLKLKKGLQRYMLYYTLQVKSSDKRLERSIMMLNNLKRIPIGKEDFRRILGKD